MVVGDEPRLAQGFLHGFVAEYAAGQQPAPQGRLGDAVEVEVVLAYELVHLGVRGAPEIAPGILRQPETLVHGHGERYGRPEALGPAPNGETFHAIEDRGLHAPFDIAGDPERHQGLAGAEAQPCCAQDIPCAVAVGDIVELHLEGCLALLGLAQAMGGQLGGEPLEGRAVIVLDVYDGRTQELPAGLGYDGADIRIGCLGIGVGDEVLPEGGQVEIPVLHGSHLGHGVRHGRTGGDELFRGIAVAQVAFIGVPVL